LGTYVTKVDQVTVPSLLQDASTLYSALINTQQLLAYDALLLPIDTTLEAEALGARVEWTDRQMPTIKEHLEEHFVVDDSQFLAKGRVPVIKEVVERLVPVQGKNLPIIATMTGPFTILSKIYGEKIFSATQSLTTQLEGVTQALVALCKTFGEAKVDGILIYEEDHIQPLLNENSSRCYRPLLNVIKFYNLFGIMRLPLDSDAGSLANHLPDAAIGRKDQVVASPVVKTKGVALTASFWSEPADQEQLCALWREQKKRRLFFSTSHPLDTEMNLHELQEKASMLCDVKNWM
jgi:hypothetical protein